MTPLKTLVQDLKTTIGFKVFVETIVGKEPEAPKPETAKSESKPEAKAAESKAPAKPAVARKASSKRLEDARQCLERSTNMEIIKCAEEYL